VGGPLSYALRRPSRSGKACFTASSPVPGDREVRYAVARCARWAPSRLCLPCGHANSLLEKTAAADVAHIGPNRPVNRGSKAPFRSPVEKMARAAKNEKREDQKRNPESWNGHP